MKGQVKPVLPLTVFGTVSARALKSVIRIPICPLLISDKVHARYGAHAKHIARALEDAATEYSKKDFHCMIRFRIAHAFKLSHFVRMEKA
jgi:hypothetical protein